MYKKYVDNEITKIIIDNYIEKAKEYTDRKMSFREFLKITEEFKEKMKTYERR